MGYAIPSANIKLKRAYEPPSASDGKRVLVDRLWPRGVKKAQAKIDEWMKDIAPSAALRKWFGHDPVRWPEFQDRYAEEVHQHPEQLDHLRTLAREGALTLVFAARDEAHNDAVVLRDLVLGRRSRKHFGRCGRMSPVARSAARRRSVATAMPWHRTSRKVRDRGVQNQPHKSFREPVPARSKIWCAPGADREPAPGRVVEIIDVHLPRLRRLDKLPSAFTNIGRASATSSSRRECWRLIEGGYAGPLRPDSGRKADIAGCPRGATCAIAALVEACPSAPK